MKQVTATACKWWNDTARVVTARAYLKSQETGYPVFGTGSDKLDDGSTQACAVIVTPIGAVYYLDYLGRDLTPRGLFIVNATLPFEFADLTRVKMNANRREQIAAAFGRWVNWIRLPANRVFAPRIIRKGVASYVSIAPWTMEVLRSGDFYAIADMYDDDGDPVRADHVRAVIHLTAADVLAAMMEHIPCSKS